LLNELAVLSRSLTARGIHVQSWHPSIQPFRKGDALVAELGEAGDVARVSLLSAKEVARLCRIAPNNHSFFPGFNLNCPIFEVADATLWNQPEALWQTGSEGTAKQILAYEGKDSRRLERLLGDFPVKELAPLLVAPTAKLQAVSALVGRLAIARYKAEAFLRALAGQIRLAEQDGRLHRTMALEILYGKPKKDKGKLDRWQISLVLEVADMEQFPYRVADPAVALELSELLLKSAPKHDGRVIRDGLTGRL
jgi:hypothetical protein